MIRVKLISRNSNTCILKCLIPCQDMILIVTIPTVQFCLRCINVYLQQWVSLRFAYFNMMHLCVFNCFLLLFFSVERCQSRQINGFKVTMCTWSHRKFIGKLRHSPTTNINQHYIRANRFAFVLNSKTIAIGWMLNFLKTQNYVFTFQNQNCIYILSSNPKSWRTKTWNHLLWSYILCIREMKWSQSLFLFWLPFRQSCLTLSFSNG